VWAGLEEGANTGEHYSRTENSMNLMVFLTIILEMDALQFTLSLNVYPRSILDFFLERACIPTLQRSQNPLNL
jgi:hypothetical protein